MPFGLAADDFLLGYEDDAMLREAERVEARVFVRLAISGGVAEGFLLRDAPRNNVGSVTF